MNAASKKNWKNIRAAAVWIAIPVLVWLWTEPVSPTLRAVASLIYISFFLFAAPLYCGAERRDGGSCRNNSLGLLIGCHLRQHRWQKMTSIFRKLEMGERVRSLFRDATTGAAVIGAGAAALSTAAAWVQILV